MQALVNTIAGALNLPPPAITIGNEAAIRPRVQREIVTAKHGQRDALWTLQRALSEAREFIYIESPAFGRTWRAPPAPVPAPVPPPPAPVRLPHEIDLIAVIAAALVARPRLKVMICTPRLPDFDPSRQGWVRAAFAQRTQAVLDLSAVATARVAAFHPVGFPGRSSPMRSTTIIVDDAWCLVGTSHVRRRGMTFDGAADIASIDRQIAKGYSAGIARFRQTLMAQKLGVTVPQVPGDATALWVRLAEPESAFGAIADLLAEGGQGRISPIWAGPSDSAVLAQADDIADPDGAKGASFATFIAAAVAGE